MSGKSDSKVPYESYSEYLKHRKLIATNSLSIDYDVITRQVRVSFDVFNKSAPWGSLTSRENYYGKKNWYATSTGLKIADTDFKYGSNGVVGIDLGIWWNLYTTSDIKHFEQFINYTTSVLSRAVNNTIEVKWNQGPNKPDINET